MLVSDVSKLALLLPTQAMRAGAGGGRTLWLGVAGLRSGRIGNRSVCGLPARPRTSDRKMRGVIKEALVSGDAATATLRPRGSRYTNSEPVVALAPST